ncbi:MAG: SdpI family protein [Candidatus Komeilibacteria bacterium]
MKSSLPITFKSEAIPLILILLTIIISYYWYPLLPQRIASHWNFAGEVDGWSSKNFMTFFLPSLMVGLYLLFIVLPYLDPKRERYSQFAHVYHIFKTLIIALFFLLFFTTNLYNLGYHISIATTTSLAVGLMMIILGNYMGKIKSNWFMGIRTPWTLSSENVWNKTHRLGGWLFMLYGLAIIIAPYLSATWGATILFGGALVLVGGTFLYSYILYAQEQKNKTS